MEGCKYMEMVRSLKHFSVCMQESKFLSYLFVLSWWTGFQLYLYLSCDARDGFPMLLSLVSWRCHFSELSGYGILLCLAGGTLKPDWKAHSNRLVYVSEVVVGQPLFSACPAFVEGRLCVGGSARLSFILSFAFPASSWKLWRYFWMIFLQNDLQGFEKLCQICFCVPCIDRRLLYMEKFNDWLKWT